MNPWGAVLLLLLAAGAPRAQDAAVDFVRDIQPIFKEHCHSCHSEKKPKGQFRLDSKSLALRGGVSGKVILPGRGKESLLVAGLLEADADARMPQKADPLPRAKIDLIRAWIDQGAAWPDDAGAGSAAIEQHWAHVKPVRAEPPKVRDAAWGRNPVDAFIAAGLEGSGLKPRPELAKPLLLRRLYLDLIGLPPTREEVQAFVADASTDAYERIVDRLLADPRHGERWGRHWMDVWRYSDWAGYDKEIRDSMRHIWRWRDWIIESLNADKPYDRMIVEMLAGDEVAPEDADRLRATGFLARNWQKFSRDAWMQNVVEHTAKAFLGTTMNCARCHGHFFDPISHEEYYQFRAFFEPYNVRTDALPGQPDLLQDGLPRAFDADPSAATYLYVRGNEKDPDKARALPPAVPRILGGSPLRIEPVPLPRSAVAPDKRAFVIQDLLAADAKEVEKARAKVEAAQQAISKEEQLLAAEESAKARQALQAALEELPVVLAALPLAEAKHAALKAVVAAEQIEDAGDKTSEAFTKAAEAALAAQRQQAVLEARLGRAAALRAVGKARALTEKKDEKIEAAKKKLVEAEAALSKADAESKKPPGTAFVRRKLPTYPAQSTGRRLALARWIADVENPLTARVAMNHLWLRHFGKPLVPTVFEFGRHGRPGSHPALLDWLATEFMQGRWSLRRMHRVMVTSSAYRMDSTADAAGLAADPENRKLWRMNPRRMEAELVRDCVLAASGDLDLTRGGPDLDPALGLSVPRRSVYFRHAAEKQMGFLSLFDGASVTECYERGESVVPQQALALANSALVLEKARLLAARMSKEAPDAEAFVATAFERILGRPASGTERLECLGFLKSQESLLSGGATLSPFAGGGAVKVGPSPQAAQRARESLAQVLFNHNDFVMIR